MWLFTTFGFFSIVRKPGTEVLTVRSRTRGDLIRLRRHFLPQLSEPLEHAGTDYRWRAVCSHDDFAQGMPRIIDQIQYSNFKDEVAAWLGPQRADRYAHVWGQLLEMKDECNEAEGFGWDRLPWVEDLQGSKPVAYGCVVVDRTGRFLLREVAGHFDGYVWSFAKSHLKPGEHPRSTAQRAVVEEMGRFVHILAPLHGTFSGGTTTNRYFLAVADHDAQVGSFRSEHTAGLNALGRSRDLQVLDAACSMLPPDLGPERPIVRSTDWPATPMGYARDLLHYERTFSRAEAARLFRGYVPSSMDHKWFVHTQDAVVHLHRGWPGVEVFRLALSWQPGGDRWRLVEVHRSTHPSVRSMNADSHLLDAVLSFVIDS
jgi:hypothetical protein